MERLLVFLLLVISFSVFSVRAVRSFYRAWKDIELEATEGVYSRPITLVEGKGQAVFASKVQFFCCALSFASTWALAVSYHVFQWYLHWSTAWKTDLAWWHQAETNSCLAYMATVFLDSVSNDLCTHVLSLFVADDALATAQRVREERAMRDGAAPLVTEIGHRED